MFIKKQHKIYIMTYSNTKLSFPITDTIVSLPLTLHV